MNHTDQHTNPWRTALATTLLAATLLAAPAAHAQMYFDAGGSFAVPNMAGPAIVGSSMNSYIRRAERGRKPPRSAAPHPRGTRTASLRIGSDPVVSRQVRQAFRDQLVASNPERTADIDRALSRNWLSGYRSDIAQPNGLDAGNLADALTAHTISTWALVHRAANISPRAIAAVRDDMRAELPANRQVSRLDAAARQRLGEALIYQTVLNMANREYLHRSGDRALAEQAARRAREDYRAATGIDLTNLRLTDRGLVPH